MRSGSKKRKQARERRAANLAHRARASEREQLHTTTRVLAAPRRDPTVFRVPMSAMARLSKHNLVTYDDVELVKAFIRAREKRFSIGKTDTNLLCTWPIEVSWEVACQETKELLRELALSPAGRAWQRSYIVMTVGVEGTPVRSLSATLRDDELHV